MQAIIGHVMPDSPAAKAGIQDGDRIVALDGKKNPTWEDVGLKEVTSAYRPMHLTIERNGKRFDTTVTPALSERIGRGLRRVGRARRDPDWARWKPGYPAEKAGLKKGDLLMAVNGPADALADQIPGDHQEQQRQADRDRVPARRTAACTSRCSRYSAKLDGPAALDDRRDAAAEAEPDHHQALVSRRVERIGAAEQEGRRC